MSDKPEDSAKDASADNATKGSADNASKKSSEGSAGKTAAKDAPEKSEKKNSKPLNKSAAAAGALGVVAVGAIAGAVYFATGGGDNDALSNGGDDETVEVADGRGEATPGDEGRVEAVYAAADVLSDSFIEAESDEEYVEILSEMDEGDFSSVPEEAQDAVRLVDVFEDDDAAKATALQAVISISAMIKDDQNIEVDEDIVPAVDDDELAELVLYDQEMGTAYVPLSVFAPDFAVFTMEMVYTEDDGWVLAPYTLMEGVTIFTLAEQQAYSQMEGMEDMEMPIPDGEDVPAPEDEE